MKPLRAAGGAEAVVTQNEINYGFGAAGAPCCRARWGVPVGRRRLAPGPALVRCGWLAVVRQPRPRRAGQGRAGQRRNPVDAVGGAVGKRLSGVGSEWVEFSINLNE